MKRGIKLVAVDTPQVDHPLATSLGPHRNGPQMKRLPKRVRGRDRPQRAERIFPNGIRPIARCSAPASRPIENVGGDLDALLGKRCTFQAYPWNWPKGDACPIRFVAISRSRPARYRLEPGGDA